MGKATINLLNQKKTKPALKYAQIKKKDLNPNYKSKNKINSLKVKNPLHRGQTIYKILKKSLF